MASVPPSSFPRISECIDSEAETVMQLRNELRDKEMKLTDIRLEALSSAHQLDQLREAMNRMQVSGWQTESQEAAEWKPRGAGMLAVAASLSLFSFQRVGSPHIRPCVSSRCLLLPQRPLHLAFSLPSLAPLVTHWSGTEMSDSVPIICFMLFLPL